MSPDSASPEKSPTGIGNRLRSTSLGTRLFTLISLFAAVVGVTLVVVVPRQLDELARDSIKVRADELASVAATAAAPGLDFGDSTAVNKILAALSSAPDITYAVVLRQDGTTFAGWNAEKAPAYVLAQQSETLFFRDGMIHRVVSLKTASGLSGRVALGLSLARLEALRERHLVTATVLACIIFLGGAIFSLLVARLLTGPIQRMAQVAVYISQGNLARGEQLLGGARAVSQMSRDIGTQNLGGEEMTYLARAFATMLNSFRESTVKLHESTQLLTSSVKNLQTASVSQEQAIQRQADTLELTRTTAEQILRNSESAQGRARDYLNAAGEAERLGASASSTLERSLAGLTGIRGEVVEIERRIAQLGEHGKRIEEITLAVQSIADHSNVLAVNAAIEAALAGEQGKGFAVVAREFRDLANQSLRETEMVRTILADIRRATDSTVELTAAGARKIDQGLGEVRASSETLRELSRMTVESSRAMTEIAATVQQQNSEILQIFENVSALSKLMELTISQVGVTSNAVKVIDSVSQTVAGVAGRYEL